MKAYAAVHKNNIIRMRSRSGGAFAALARKFIAETHGSVYGAAIVDGFEVKHIRVTNEGELDALSGAKYVQSDMRDALPKLKKDFSENRDVLFSGTPCQTAAVKELIPSGYTGNTLLIDIVCHSVPSPEIYRRFMAQYKPVKEFIFRNKEKFGWRENISTIKKQKREIHTLAYCNIFYNTANMRPSCYNCPWKAERPGDITIGDCWGVEKAAPELDDNFGVSVVLTNTENGQMWWDKTSDVMEFKEVEPSSVRKQHALNKPLELPPDRALFWQDYQNMPFGAFVRKYGNMGLKKRIRIIAAGYKIGLKGVHHD